ncbi:MAG: PaaI family thioesterase [Thermodesulfovibrionaceae bacterium]
MRKNYCFVCGRENPKGLKAEFNSAEGRAYCEISIEKDYEGYSGIIHGGIVAALLDEACVYAGNSLGFHTVTAEIKIRFKKPVKPYEKILIHAEAKPVKSKLIEARATAYNSEEVVAEAASKLIIKEKVN